MAKKKLKPLNVAMVGVVASALLLAYGFLLSFVEAPLGQYFAFTTAVLSVVWWKVGQKIRKGKETWVATVGMIVGITLFFMALDLLPFNIPYLTFTAEMTWFGLVKTAGIVWVSESLVKRFM